MPAWRCGRKTNSTVTVVTDLCLFPIFSFVKASWGDIRIQGWIGNFGNSTACPGRDAGWR